jgi:hypothetical protein
MSDFEEIKRRAYETRDKYLAGLITKGEAKAELKEYIKLFNQKAEEIAAKYNQKPQRLRVSEFLKTKLY